MEKQKNAASAAAQLVTGKPLKVSGLNPWEPCDRLDTMGGMYIVWYPVDGTSDYKVGLVVYGDGTGAKD